jgi:hypothetical protein
MPKVEIAHDVYESLQRRAVPFEDDINDVLRRLLRGDRSTFARGPEQPKAPAPAPILQPVSAEPAPAATDRQPTLDDDTHDEAHVIVHRRAATGNHLTQSTVRAAVVGILKSSANAVTVPELFQSVERQLRARMTDADLETSPSGLARWQSQTRNALTQLQHEARIERIGRIGEDLYRYRTAGSSAMARTGG